MYQDVIGVLGGMGSFATLHFFRALLKAFPAEKEWDRPRIIIDNRCTMPSRVLAVLEGKDRDRLVSELSDSVRSLLSAGATKIVLACNTSHCFLDDIYRNVPEAQGRIISIIEACCRQIAETGEKEVSLIASEGTIRSGVFAEGLAPYGIAIRTPENEQYLMQRELIEAVKQDKITPEAVQKFTELVTSFSNEALILGCTEFPVLYSAVPDGAFDHLRIYDPLVSVIRILQKECR
ncbi:MAG: aspartate/glutamate racemase family protein [Clostridia bacterium]|nr:aspartate/glutamate racemase family protein [Clostridia bacterium]